MGLSYDAAERLFRLGEFAEIVRLSDHGASMARTLEPEHRLIVAHSLAFTGELEKATDLASMDARPSVALRTRSRAELILGLVCERKGELPAACQHFQSAVRFAAEANDSERVAWAFLRLFRTRIEGHPIEALMGMIPEARRVVIRAGLPQVSAYLHICLSVLEGQTGRFEESVRHCDIADSLLLLSPNAWLSGNLLLNRACIACSRCDFAQASDYIRNARQFTDRTGSTRDLAVMDNNLGHVETLTGQFDKAHKSFLRVLDSDQQAFVGLGALDGLARLYLALGRLDECHSSLDRVQDYARNYPSLASMYPVRWSAIARARLLLRRGALEEALNWLEHIEQESQAVGDVPFTAALHLVSAQALAKSERSADAAVRILLASHAGITGSRELQPQYYFASGQITRQSSAPFSEHLQVRAIRVWDQQRNLSVRLEMADHVSADSVTLTKSSMLSKRASLDVMCVTDSLAAAIDLAHSPRLLGTELIEVIRTLECSPQVKVVETRLNALEPQGGETQLTLALGARQHKKFTLVCAAPDEPLKAVLLADVLRIGGAAVALERARQEERARAALWPASPVEEQAGALFLAEEMQSLLTTVRRIAPTTVPVLITGETGTGKEVIARLLHGYSTRAAATFLPFNCTATPKEMLDSQLFGYRKGAFTGASDHFPGVIRAAGGGTLFLDEIGETTLDVQPKLLRFLESGEVHPIGEVQPVHVDVRIIAATNANLDALVAQNRFREDLFYRLNIVRLHVPPLRERRVEIPALANHYLQKHAQEYRKGDLRLAEETMEYLVLYRWPGNVRQLANEMRRMAALAETGAVLMPEHLSADIAASRRTIPASERVLDPTEVVVRLDQPMAAAVQHVERAMMQYAMRKCDGRMEQTAAMLGLSRKGLYLKRQRYGFEPLDAAPPAVDVA